MKIKRRKDFCVNHQMKNTWKHFDKKFYEFAVELRNLRLGLYVDGLTPYGQLEKPYFYLSMIVISYNLSPQLDMIILYMFRL